MYLVPLWLAAVALLGTLAHQELRWWMVRREIGLAAGEAAGRAITALYASIYGVPEAIVSEAGHLRGEAAEVRDRGAVRKALASYTSAGRVGLDSERFSALRRHGLVLHRRPSGDRRAHRAGALAQPRLAPPPPQAA